jgi:rod shape-determining protein MreC
MPAGTLDHSPPPFFRQGPSALSQLCFFAALALFLMMADVRWQMTDPLRSALALALTPLQRALGAPVRLVENANQYLTGLRESQLSAQSANARLVALSERANRVELLTIENQRLRALLELRAALQISTLSAELLYESADVYSRKVTIDRGSQHGLLAGSPVINEAGVLGQVTRVYPFTAEVTLLVDKDAAIPVLNLRTQQRSVAFGGSNLGTRMELRYLTVDTNIEPGDLLQTNGLDGVYPPNLPVGRVVSVTRKAESGFARVVVQPAAAEEGVRHVLVLSPLSAQLPPRPSAVPEGAGPVVTERKLSSPRRAPSKAASAP